MSNNAATVLRQIAMLERFRERDIRAMLLAREAKEAAIEKACREWNERAAARGHDFKNLFIVP